MWDIWLGGSGGKGRGGEDWTGLTKLLFLVPWVGSVAWWAVRDRQPARDKSPYHANARTLTPPHPSPTESTKVRDLFNKRNQTPAGPRGEDDEGYSAVGATPPRPAVGAQQQ